MLVPRLTDSSTWQDVETDDVIDPDFHLVAAHGERQPLRMSGRDEDASERHQLAQRRRRVGRVPRQVDLHHLAGKNVTVRAT